MPHVTSANSQAPFASNRSSQSTSALSAPLSAPLQSHQIRVAARSSSPSQLADNTPAGATNLGILRNTVIRNGYVGANDTVDHYRFTYNRATPFHLALTGLRGNVNVQLLNSAGHAIATSQRPGAADEAINLASLGAGTYTIRVNRISGNTPYTLKASTSPISNLLPAEVHTGRLMRSHNLNGRVSASDTTDVYAFSLNSATDYLRLTVRGMSSDVDVRLIRDANHNRIVDAGDVVTSSTVRGLAVEEAFAAVQPGTYFAQVIRAGGDTQYTLGISPEDWFSFNLGDEGVEAQSRLAAADGKITRNEMLGILRSTKDDGVVSATELSDLRQIVNSTEFQMPDYVKNLSNKVVYMNMANTASGIGNLRANSSATQLEQLIGKWFLGSDRPNPGSGVTYQAVNGSLFQNGISYQDVMQGNLGNSYLLASVAAIARQSPSTIQDMFIDNGDGTFTVRFYKSGPASTEAKRPSSSPFIKDMHVDYVTVDRFLPTNGNSRMYAGWGGTQPGGNSLDDSNNELWVALLEKAYAQANQSGGITLFGGHSYDAIQGGSPSASLRHLLGGISMLRTPFNDSNINEMMTRFDQGGAIVLSTSAGLSQSAPSGVVANRGYAMVGYTRGSDPSQDTFRLYNPWGSEVNVTRSQLNQSFIRWESTIA
jgi:hypothetical protein